MKKVLLMLVFMITSIIANASHMMGGDIAYECISPGKYKLVVKVYRDCRGIAFNNPDIKVFCKDGSNQTTVNYTRTAINDITEICKTGTPPCNPQNTYNTGEGIEEHVFEAIVDFNTSPFKAIKDAGCCEVMIKVEQCCRNGAITNINPGNFYTDAMINICNIDKTNKKCNTSPQLSIPPVAYVCCNMPFTYNNGVREVVDGDSISYDLVNPLNGNNSNETYTGNLNSQIPMTPYCPPNPGIINCRPLPNAKSPRGWYFDKETGDIVFTPTKCDEIGVVVIQVTEWRKDSTNKWVKIGYTRRDMQLIVKQCAKNNPPYFGINNKYSVCEGNKICFDIVSKDDPFLPNQTVGDTITLTWNYGIPQGTFTIKDPTAREKTAQFCWETKIGDARPNPYSFTATAKDDNCDNPSQANKGYNITVKPKARTVRKYTLGDCGWLKWKATPVDTINQNPKNYVYQFTIRDSTNSGVPFYMTYKQLDSFKFKRGGKYIIEHFVNNTQYQCPTIYTDTVIIPPVLDVKLAFGKDTFLCNGDSLIVKPIIANGVPSYKYVWNFIPALPSPFYINNQTISLKRNTNTTVYIKLTDSNKCVDYDTIKVKVIPLPVVNIGPDRRICTYDNIVLDAQNADTMMYEWNTGDFTRLINVNIANKYSVKVSDSVYRCFSRDTMQLFVNDTVIAIAKPDREICIFDTLKVKPSRKPIGYTRTITWKDLNTGGTVSNDSSFKIRINTLTTRNYEMYLKVTQGGIMCEDKDTLIVSVNALPTFQFNGLQPRCYADGAINLTMNNVATARSGDKSQIEKDIRYYQNKKPSWITGGPVGVNTYVYDYPKFISNAQIPKTGLTDSVCYDFRDYKQCYNKECKPIKLNPNPVVELKTGTFCQSAGLISLDKLVKSPFVKIGGIQTFKCLVAPSGADPNSIIISNTSVIPNTFELDPGNEGENDKTGVYKIEYTFKDALTGCQASDTIDIIVVKLPVIKFGFIPSQCINYPILELDSFITDDNTGTRMINGIWSVAEYRKSRDLTNTFVAKAFTAINNNKFNPGASGPGQYLLKFSDNSTGCLVEDSLEVIVNGLPMLVVNNPDTICSSAAPLVLNNVLPSGNVGKWSGVGVTNREFDPSISPKTKLYEGRYKFRYTFTNPITNCSDTTYDSILVQSQPEVKINGSKPYQQCEGIPFDITGTKKWADSVKWSSNGDGTFIIGSPLNITYKHGLQDTVNNNVVLRLKTKLQGVCPIAYDTIPLIIEPYPQFDFIGNPLIQCEPGLVDFTCIVRKPKSNIKYRWDFGNGDTSNVANPFNIRYDTANRQWYDVTLTIRNEYGSGVCATTLYKPDYIKILPQPKAAFGSEPNFFTTVAFPKFKFKNQSTIRWGADSVSYLWNFNSKDIDDTSTQINPIKIYPVDTTTYWVNLIAYFTYKNVTCSDSIGALRKIGPDVIVFVPNVFSPENTGPEANNKFRAVVSGEKTFHIEVLNRWGEMLWKTDNKYEGWDGTYRGEDAQQDVYVWVVKVIAYDGEEYQFEGTITLVR
jgi:gliding motility-associated-like protein